LTHNWKYRDICCSGTALAVFALAFLLSSACEAASPGPFLSLFPAEKNENGFFFMLQGDQQMNEFPKQRKRRPEVDSNNEERHFSEIRSSEVTFATAGMKTGFSFKGLPYIYLLGAYAEADVDFSFTDELTGNKRSYSEEFSFDTDDFIVAGGGLAARFFRKPVFGDSHLSIGADLQYRWLEFEASRGRVAYESTLHEIQLSLAAALEEMVLGGAYGLRLMVSPYAGAKIIHFIGDERFSDPANIDSTGEPDPIFYTGDLQASEHIAYFVGTGIGITEHLLMGLEARFGDDDGYAVHLGLTF
jgi:hypothetical protein